MLVSPSLPSSRICSYFRMATCRRQAFWITRAKPSNFRSRISSRRKSWEGHGVLSTAGQGPPSPSCVASAAHWHPKPSPALPKAMLSCVQCPPGMQGYGARSRAGSPTDSGFLTNTLLRPIWYWSGSMLTERSKCCTPCRSSPRQDGHVSGVRIA